MRVRIPGTTRQGAARRRRVQLLSLLVPIVLASCGRGSDGRSGATWQEDEAAESSALAVEAVEVTRGSFVDRIEISGLIAGIQEADVVSETSGIVQEVRFDLGDTVERGQVLVRLDDSIERLAMEEAKSQADTAAVELSAAERLFENGNFSQADLSRARAAAAGAQARYQRARKAYQDQTLRAPISGAIATRDTSVTEGNYLRRGVVVGRIVDTRRFRLAGAVGEREVRYLQAGVPADVEIPACPEAAPAATVTAVAAGSDPRTGSFPVIVEWDNSCGGTVRSGMTARALIRPKNAEEVMVVPAGAIVQRGEEHILLIAQDGVAAEKVVEVGRRYGGKAEIVSGLAIGDLVVTSGLSTLQDGDPIDATVVGKSGELL